MAATVSNSSERLASTLTPHQVLPPIIICDKDRDFLIQLNSYIDDELSRAKDKNNPEERFSIYREAFDQVVEYVTAYKPILTAIKAEYEDCIDVILRGQKEAFFLSGKLKAMASEPSTIRNYRKRIDELEIRVGKIKAENEVLRTELENLRKKKQERLQLIQEHEQSPRVSQKKKDTRYLHGLNLEQSTDLQILTKELEKLERQVRELMICHRTRYMPREKQISLKEHLSTKVTQRDEVVEESERLKVRSHKLKIAVEAAQAYLRLQPPHETIGDAVLNAFARQSSLSFTQEKGLDDGTLRQTPSTVFEEDDPSREKEAELMLEYIERFNELLEDEKYEEAAVHATNSPKGILRTPETMNRFREIQNETTSLGRSPLLAFCDNLMASVPAYAQLPSQAMSLACTEVAMKECQLSLLSHWLSQERMTLSMTIGEQLEEYAKAKPTTAKQCLAMAQKVYVDINEHKRAVVCMIKQGRLNQAVAYASKHQFNAQDYMAIFQLTVVDPYFVEILQKTKYNGKPVMPLGQLLLTLIGCGHEKLACNVMREFEKPPPDAVAVVHDSLQKMINDDNVTQYEQWESIVEFFQHRGYPKYAMNIIASVLVQMATDKASSHVVAMPQSEEEETDSPTQDGDPTTGNLNQQV